MKSLPLCKDKQWTKKKGSFFWSHLEIVWLNVIEWDGIRKKGEKMFCSLFPLGKIVAYFQIAGDTHTFIYFSTQTWLSIHNFYVKHMCA